MKIQLALDRLTKEECFQLINETKDSIDIVEIGTGIIKEYGVSIVKEMKERNPSLSLLADMKTCDDGMNEAKQAFRSGADIMTVMAFSANKTISDALSVAEKYGKRIMIDLLGSQSRERVEELVALGCDLFCIHLGKDMQQNENLDIKRHLKLVENIKTIEVAVAGGINAQTAKEMSNYPFNILIVGSAITLSENPRFESEKINSLIKS